MVSQITLGDIAVELVFKDIKNLHLSVHPPSGRVRIAAPTRMSLDTVRVFAISKLSWIKQQQRKLQEQERETPREYQNRESHYVWGQRYLLKVSEDDAEPSIELNGRCMVLRVRPGTGEQARHTYVERWYRDKVKEAASSLIGKWQPHLAVTVAHCFVQRMKTRWGSCNPIGRTIRLNTELAKKPKECLEYIVVHEMLHLLEPTHNARFIALLDRHLPRWQFCRQTLNSLPVPHADWAY